MQYSRTIAAAVAVLALAAAAPAVAAASTTPITWYPLGAVEPGAQIDLYTNDLPALFAGGCGSGTGVKVTVGGVPVAAANLDWAILLTLPLDLRSNAQIVVTAPACHAEGSQVLNVATPIIAQATAQVVTQAGGQETATAGQPVTVTGTGFGVGQGPGFEVLLSGQPCGCQDEGWGAGEIIITLPQGLATAAYTLAVRTSAGTSMNVPLYVLSVSDAQALAAGKQVALPWASGSGRAGGAGGGGSVRAVPSGSGTRSPTGGGRDGGAGSPGGGGRSGHGAAGWQWPLLVGLGSLVAALAALAPWRRKRRAGAGQVQVEAPEPEPPAAEPEAEEQDPEGGDAP